MDQRAHLNLKSPLEAAGKESTKGSNNATEEGESNRVEHEGVHGHGLLESKLKFKLLFSKISLLDVLSMRFKNFFYFPIKFEVFSTNTQHRFSCLHLQEQKS